MLPPKKHNNPPELYDGVTFTRGPMHINHFTKYQNAESTH